MLKDLKIFKVFDMTVYFWPYWPFYYEMIIDLDIVKGLVEVFLIDQVLSNFRDFEVENRQHNTVPEFLPFCS